MFSLIVLQLIALAIAVGVASVVRKRAGAKDGDAAPPRSGAVVGGSIWAVLAVGALLMSCFTTVAPSTQGVVVLFGQVQQGQLGEGAHLVNPAARVHAVFTGLASIKAEKAEAASKDLQSVHTSMTVNYSVNPAQARALYILNPSLDYENTYVLPAVFEVFKAVAANYTAEQLVTRRQAVSADIHAALNAKLSKFFISVQDINITNFSFSKSFDEAIEAKVTASQKAEQAERELQTVKFEAEQKIAAAKGQAEAIRIQAEAVKAQGGSQYVQLEAIKKWDGRLPTYTGGNTPLPFIDAGKDGAR